MAEGEVTTVSSASVHTDGSPGVCTEEVLGSDAETEPQASELSEASGSPEPTASARADDENDVDGRYDPDGRANEPSADKPSEGVDELGWTEPLGRPEIAAELQGPAAEGTELGESSHQDIGPVEERSTGQDVVPEQSGQDLAAIRLVKGNPRTDEDADPGEGSGRRVAPEAAEAGGSVEEAGGYWADSRTDETDEPADPERHGQGALFEKPTGEYGQTLMDVPGDESGEVPGDQLRRAVLDGTQLGETGPGDGTAWDDGLIARRARETMVPSGRRTHTADEAADASVAVTRPLPASETATEAASQVQTTDIEPRQLVTGPPEVAADSATVPVGAQEPVPDQRSGPGESPEEASSPGEKTAEKEEERGEDDRAGSTLVSTEPLPQQLSSVAYGAEGVGKAYDANLLPERIAALQQLIDLSRTRVGSDKLAGANRVLTDASSRGRLPHTCTTVAIAGATGSGKSSLFNALAGARLSEPGLRRPTTVTPVSCTWDTEPGSGNADGLLDRLGIAPSMRCVLPDEASAGGSGPAHPDRQRTPGGLVLIDMPDHDSAAPGHRERADQLLRLVDSVVWVVDPEKYADAVLHERYLRPLAGHAEVTFVVLNQTDRLPGEATDTVLYDLRRLLDEDGIALGEHGESGARVFATSALTGEGVSELRAELGDFAAAQQAAALRLSADLDTVVRDLRSLYTDAAAAATIAGLTDEAREEFEGRLGVAVGAVAAGQTAQRAWLRHAERTCGTPWAQLWHWIDLRRRHGQLRPDKGESEPSEGGSETAEKCRAEGRCRSVARPVVEQAVRTLADQAAVGLPEVWRRSVLEVAWRGAVDLPGVLDEALVHATDDAASDGELAGGGAFMGSAQSGAGTGAAASTPSVDSERQDESEPRKSTRERTSARVGGGKRPLGWTVAVAGQSLLLAVQTVGVLWLLVTALAGGEAVEWVPLALLAGGVGGSQLLAWICRLLARGPARAHGQREEWRLRRLVADHGREAVLQPVTEELLRYRQVREHYAIASGDMREL